MTVREAIERIRNSTAATNEETAKFQIISPILRALGWDMNNDRGTGEVRFEHSIGSGRTQGRVDIALMGSKGNCVCLIEAKSPGSKLEDHVEQVLGYAFHEGASICVLTTGLEWWLYLPREAGKPEDRKFTELRIGEDPLEQLVDEFEAFLDRQQLRTVQAEREAQKALRCLHEASQVNTALPSIWQKMLAKPDEELVELVRAKVYAEIRLRPSEQQVAAALRGQPLDKVPPVRGGKASASELEGEKKGRRSPAKAQKPTSIVLFGKVIPVKHSFEIMGQTACEVYRRHPFDFQARGEPLAGRSRPFASADPDAYIRPYELNSSGLFVNVNLSQKNAIKRSRRLLEHFGHDPDKSLVVNFD